MSAGLEDARREERRLCRQALDEERETLMRLSGIQRLSDTSKKLSEADRARIAWLRDRIVALAGAGA